MKHILPAAIVILLLSMTGCAVPAEKAVEEEINFQDNGIAVISLQIDPQEFVNVNDSPDHSYRAEGASITVTDADGNTTEALELDYIRGRGHGTWEADKKPYRFKLKKSLDLLGMGANKNWILLANRYDSALLRNRIISYIGEQMGLSYTPQSVPVDLVVNGEYRGSYVLSEQVRIGKSRIEIDELKEEDIAEPEVSGGYLVCLNPDYDEAAENIFITNRMVRFGNEEPQFSEGENGVPEQKAYITSYLQETEDVIFADDEDKRPADYMDMRSAADYWWIQEFSGNHDAFITGSTYLYKERGGKLYWGPLWDFDLSLGDGLDAVDGFAHRNMIWLDHLRAYDPEYQQLLYERWKVLEPVIADLVREGGVIDAYAEEIRKSWEDDQRRWPIPDDDGGTVKQDFDQEIERLKNWMEQRRAWINANIDSELHHVYNTAVFKADGNVFRNEAVLHDAFLDKLPQAPYKEGCIFSHWEYEDGKPYEYEHVDRDIVLNAVYVPADEAVTTEGIYFANPQEVWADIHSRRYDPAYELLPEDTIDKNIRWSVSDPELAEIDEYGRIMLKKTGKTTVTAKLYTGAENSFVLHIYDSLKEEKEQLKQLMTEEPEIRLQTGGYCQIRAYAVPSLCDCDLLYSTDNEDIAVVDYFGVVHALKPGEAEITVTSAGDSSVMAKVKITVE